MRINTAQHLSLGALMTVSFKQFTTFLAASDGEHTQEKLDEIWKSIFAKKQEEEDEDDAKKVKTMSGVMTAKERLEAKKKKEEERKKELQKKRDDAWNAARERAQGGQSRSARSAHADDRRGSLSWMREAMLEEGRESYSDEGYWKDDAKAAGYKIKKLSGNLEDGDQTWGAFDGDTKMGEFTEAEDGRGGWLKT